MSRFIYWALAIIGLLLVLLGFAVFQSPGSASVDAELLDKWYLNTAIWAAVLGVVLAVGAGFLVDRVVSVRPREVPAAYNGRAITFGVVAAVVAAVLAVLLALYLASAQAEWQLSGRERVTLVLESGRFWAIPGLALLAFTLLFAGITRGRRWPGRHILF